MTSASDHGAPRIRGDAVIPRELVADVMITRPKVHDLNARLEELRDFFEDDHVQMALIVSANRRLFTTIERSDLTAGSTASRSAAELGTLAGRTTGPAVALDAAAALLLKGARRRLAVVDDSGRLLGLLCLKKDLTGYCSDESIRWRCGPIV